jgi:hypothetical protein
VPDPGALAVTVAPIVSVWPNAMLEAVALVVVASGRIVRVAIAEVLPWWPESPP